MRPGCTHEQLLGDVIARIAELERERDVTGNLLDSAIAELQKYKRGYGDE